MAVRNDFTAGEVLAAADLNDTFASKLDVTDGQAENRLTLNDNTSDGIGAVLLWQYSRGTSGSPTVVQSGDLLGQINSTGYDGANYRAAAQINLKVDAGAGISDMPGRIEFLTTTDNSTTMAERMRINSIGHTFVGQTSVPSGADSSAGSLYVAEVVAANGFASHSGRNGAYQANVFNIQWNGSAARLWIDGVDQGSISIVSDYRLKHQIADAPEAWDRLKAIRPVTYRWRDESIYEDDGTTHEGFIAHELAEVIPSAVNYEKDALNENGDQQYQSLNLSEMLPVLVKALQESQQRIETLEARLDAAGL
jgi:hypothetical protein